MSHDYENRKYLVIGGTGMLAEFCQSLPAYELIMASRLRSNQQNLAKFDTDILQIALDYTDEQSDNEFLEQLSTWQGLEYLVLWVYSPAHDFSCEVIKTLAKSLIKPNVIHIFGTDFDDNMLSSCADEFAVDYTAVKLGRVMSKK